MLGASILLWVPTVFAFEYCGSTCDFDSEEPLDMTHTLTTDIF